MDATELQERLTLDAYPRSARYDAAWVADNMMGPHPLWLLESLLELVDLAPGERVLDLGCGKALTSIFLARELDVRVVAHDWWIPAADNEARIADQHESDRVEPVHAEAHTLPFAAESFDAILSVDAYQYFGTADLYLAQLLTVLRPGGTIAIVVPATVDEIGVDPPAHLRDHWAPDFACFHTPRWWHDHWVKSGIVTVERAELVPDFADHWLRWCEVTDEWARARGRTPFEDETALLRADRGRTLGFARVVARKRSR